MLTYRSTTLSRAMANKFFGVGGGVGVLKGGEGPPPGEFEWNALPDVHYGPTPTHRTPCLYVSVRPSVWMSSLSDNGKAASSVFCCASLTTSLGGRRSITLSVEKYRVWTLGTETSNPCSHFGFTSLNRFQIKMWLLLFYFCGSCSWILPGIPFQPEQKLWSKCRPTSDGQLTWLIQILSCPWNVPIIFFFGLHSGTPTTVNWHAIKWFSENVWENPFPQYICLKLDFQDGKRKNVFVFIWKSRFILTR